MYKIFTALRRGGVLRCRSKLCRIMKLSFLFSLVALLQVNAATLGQNITLNKTNASLAETLEDIHAQSGYSVMSVASILTGSQPVTIHVENKPLADVLNICFANQPFSYKLNSKTIVVIPKKTNDNAQVPPIKISGTVNDNKGSPLPGVTVKVKEAVSNNKPGAATVTDLNGRFTINVQKGKTLVFSFIGYQTQEVIIGDQIVVNITLQESSNKLNEVVVVGYGTQSSKLVSSSISKVSGDDIGNQPVGTPGEALAGLASGVQVQSGAGATPGAPPTILVRGISSLGSSNDPLFVVDGYPLDSSDQFNQINPTDIESISVLKDAASSAIYGSRAANGVIIVTTKRGKAGKTVFSFSSYTGIQQVNRYVDVLDRDDYISFVEDVNKINKSSYPSIFNTDPQDLPDVNWQKQIFRTAPITSADFTASGGSDKVRFNTSVGYFKQEGVLIGSEYTRLTTRLNLDADIAKNLKFSFSIAPSYSEQYREPGSGQFSQANGQDQLIGVPGLLPNLNLPGPLNQALILAPVLPAYKPNGDFQQPFDLSLNYNVSATSPFYPTAFLNPLGIISQAINRQRAFRTLGNASVTYTPIRGLSLKTFIGSTLDNALGHGYIPATMAYSSSPNASFSNPSLAGVYASDNSRTSIGWVWENTATYDRTFGKHHFNLLGLFSAQRTDSQIEYTGGLPGTFVTTAVQSPLASPNTVGTVGYDANDYVSYAGRLTYDYSGKYLLTAAIRQDGSSKFGPANRYAVFPSFSAGWRLGQEKIMRPVLDRLHISEIKLRGGYGETGNANIGSFTYANAISLSRNYALGSSRLFGTAQSGFANPDLTWEKNKQTNLGLDVGFLDDKVTLTADYFHRISDGMLLNKSLPAIVGYATSYKANLGKLQNDGIELTASTRFSFGKLKWNVNANFSTARSKILDLGGPQSLPAVAAIFGWGNVYQLKVGDPLGLMYGYTVTGVFKNANDLANNPKLTTGNNIGDWMVKDQNGDGKIDANDITPVGHGRPDFIYGLTNDFQYNNFDLSILIQGAQGVNIINGNKRQLLGGLPYENTTKDYFQNYFDPTQPDRDVKYPKLGSAAAIGTTMVSTDVENGSYLRIRNITLGYRLGNIVQKIGVKSLRVYFTAQNPFLFTKYTGYNPEASVNISDSTTPGVDQGAYPVARVLLVGVNVGF